MDQPFGQILDTIGLQFFSISGHTDQASIFLARDIFQSKLMFFSTRVVIGTI